MLEWPPQLRGTYILKVQSFLGVLLITHLRQIFKFMSSEMLQKEHHTTLCFHIIYNSLCIILN